MDLNLLAYFDALISEGQVSRAAERVNLSQPAMSLALKRLRELFDDPLLVRTPHGMVPTTRARELIGPVREILRRSGDLLHPRGQFVPAEASGSVVLMSTDYVSMLVMPPLMRQIEMIAPGVRIDAQAVDPEQLRYRFESGRVDIGVGICVNPPGELRIRQAFEEQLVCIARAGHPDIEGRLTLEQFMANPHVQIRPGDMRYALLLERAFEPPWPRSPGRRRRPRFHSGAGNRRLDRHDRGGSRANGAAPCSVARVAELAPSGGCSGVELLHDLARADSP